MARTYFCSIELVAFGVGVEFEGSEGVEHDGAPSCLAWVGRVVMETG